MYILRNRALSFIGLFLIGVGTGGIKPCVATFGGEQFVMPYQKKEMTRFFSLFYAAVNCGSLISVLVTPILRAETQCFGQDSCYPFAFGVPAVLMCIAVSKLFVVGLMIKNKRSCVKMLGEELIFISVFSDNHKCYFSAIFFFGRVCGLYKMTRPEDNIIVKTSACIWVIFNCSINHRR